MKPGQLQIEITTALVSSDNLEISGTAGDEYKEGLGADFLETPWKKPQKNIAQSVAKDGVFKRGQATFLGTEMKAFTELGVGIFLYFKILAVVSVLFVVLCVNCTPILYLNSQGNDGHALTTAEVDPQNFVNFTLGNLGFNPETLKDTSQCTYMNGSVDCSGETVVVFNEGLDSKRVSYAISGFVFFGIIILLVVFIRIQSTIEADVQGTDDETLSPADYSVYVRGIPKDVNLDDVISHFNKRYDLASQQLEYPILGLSITGVAFYASLCGTFLFAIIVTPSIMYSISNPIIGLGSSIGATIGIALLIAGLLMWRRVGEPRNRQTPAEEYAESKTRWEQEKEAEKKIKRDMIALKKGNFKHKINPVDCSQPSGDEAENHEEYPFPEPNFSPVGDTTQTTYENLLGTWIADINFSHPNGSLLLEYQQQKNNLKNMSIARAEAKKWHYGSPSDRIEPNNIKREKAMKKVEKLQEKINNHNLKMAKSNKFKVMDEVCGLFITFEHQRSCKRCLEDYRYSSYSFIRYFQPPELQFLHSETDKRFKLRIERAPEPSDLLWENLELTDTQRSMRTSLTNFVTFLLLVFSFIIIYLAQTAKSASASNSPDLSLCNVAIPAIFYGTYFLPKNVTLVHRSDLDPTCPSNNISKTFFFEYEGLNANPLYVEDPFHHQIPKSALSTTGRNLCDGRCVSVGPSPMDCGTLPCFSQTANWNTYDASYQCRNYRANDLIGCYCMQQVTTSVGDLGVFEGLKKVLKDDFEVCEHYVRNYFFSEGLQILAAVVVVIINILLKSFLKALSSYERHYSVSRKVRSTAIKIFLAQFVNTAIITLIVNTAYTGKRIPLFNTLGILNGRYADFTKEWYSSIGASLTMTMLINIVVPHAGLLVSFISQPILRFVVGPSSVTQDQYNAVFEGPEFDIETRYALLLNTTFVTLLFAAGIPLLVPFAAFNFLLTLVVDKFFLLKFYALPPMYDASLARMFVEMLPWALLLHIGTSIWFLSSPALLPSATISFSRFISTSSLNNDSLVGFFLPRLERLTVIPIFALFCLYLVFWLLYATLGEGFVRALKSLGRLLLWACRKKEKLHEHKLNGSTQAELGYTEFYERPLTLDEYNSYIERHSLPEADIVQGLRLQEDSMTVYKVWTEDQSRDGVEYKAGSQKRTWEVIRESTVHSYKMELNKNYKIAIKEIRKLAPMSPRLLSPKARGHQGGVEMKTVHGPFHFFEQNAGADQKPDVPLQKGNTGCNLSASNKTAPQNQDLNKLQVDGAVAKVGDNERDEKCTPASDKRGQDSVTIISKSGNLTEIPTTSNPEDATVKLPKEASEPKESNQRIQVASESNDSTPGTNQTKDQVFKEIRLPNPDSETILPVGTKASGQSDLQPSQCEATEIPTGVGVPHQEGKGSTPSVVRST